MLTEYQLTNFKAFASTVTIPIRPITLIFGPNSAGKSSILQSLLMLKQTIKKRGGLSSLLPKGDFIDLGSYKDFIYAHDEKINFSFKMIFNIKNLLSRNPYELFTTIMKLSGHEFEGHPLHDTMVDVYYELVKAISCEQIAILNSYTHGNNLLNEVIATKEDVFLGDSPIIFNSQKQNEAPIYDENHSYWEKMADLVKAYFDVPRFANEGNKQYVDRVEKICVEGNINDIQPSFEYSKNKAYAENILKDGNWHYEETKKLVSDMLDLSKKYEQFANFELYRGRKYFEYLKEINEYPRYEEIIFRFVKAQVEKTLCSIIHILPLREYPQRYYFSNETNDIFALYSNPEKLNSVNEELARHHYRMIISKIVDDSTGAILAIAPKILDLRTNIDASISDVGFGLSQILPIIIKSKLTDNSMLLIEQPELHLHPALQAEMGDLFINSALGEQKNKFIVETHSEHLILRILRRIRETSEKSLSEGIIGIKPDDLAVLYVQPGKNGSEVIEIPVTEDGDFAKKWPNGFFAERAKELM